MRHFLQHRTLVSKDAHGTQLSAPVQSHVYLLTFTFQGTMKIPPEREIMVVIIVVIQTN